jgi:hypothetical protein
METTPPTKQLITNSRKGCNDLCRKKHYWSYEIGLRRKDAAKALRMGSNWHEALDGLKQGKSSDEVVAVLRDAYADIPEGYAEEWSFEFVTLHRLLLMYQWRWHDSGIEVLATEQSFRLPLVNPATGKPSVLFDFAGVIDGIVRMEDGRLAVMEHKTLGEDHGPDSDLRRRLRIDHQISFYVDAARMLGYAVDTVLYDVTRKPSIKPTPVPERDEAGCKIVLDSGGHRVWTKDGKKPRQTASTKDGWVLQTRPMTPDEWGDKLTADIVERPDWYFARIEIPRLDDEIEEACHELWQVQKTIRESQLTGRWFRTVNRNTCPFCEYFELCSCKFDPTSGAVPEGFEYVSNKHPELGNWRGGIK